MTWVENLENWFLTEGSANFQGFAAASVAYGFMSGMVEAAEIQSFRGYLVAIPFAGLGVVLYIVSRALARRSAVAVPLTWVACTFFAVWLIRALPPPGQAEPFRLAIEYGLAAIPFTVVVLAAWVPFRLWRRGAFDGGTS